MKNFKQDFTLPPFPAFPSVSRYVPFGPVLDTLSRVSRSILAREAISLIIGPPGTGKSLACALLAKEFSASHDVVAIGETSITDETSFYRFLLNRLGVAFEAGQRDELELLIHERLCGVDANANGAVLIIDEATSLSANVLEAIRRLTNLMRDGQPVVSAVVAGGVKLDETLTVPSLESFVQRVTARCYLHPLNGDETRRYIHDSIQACDASPDETITDAAISAIHHATSGVPRLINQLMTEAIDCAAEMSESLIDEHTVDKAWACLQQLPGPMIEEPIMKRESSVVEFGALVDPVPLEDQSSAAEVFRSQPVIESTSGAEEAADAEFDVAGQFEGECRSGDKIADPVALFGEFENEEQIEVGAAQVKAVPNESYGLDVESMLHSQIVSLSQFASAKTSSRYSELDSISMMEAPAAEHDVTEPNDDAVGEIDQAFPSIVWFDESPSAEHQDQADGEVDPSQDDTDLLWITEDIEVERRGVNQGGAVAGRRVDLPTSTEAPKLSVDYREMLEKMRSQA